MKFSFGKTAFALAIVNIYLLTFSTVGSMESIPDRDESNGIVIGDNSDINISIGGNPINVRDTSIDNSNLGIPSRNESVITEITTAPKESQAGGEVETTPPNTKKSETTPPKTTPPPNANASTTAVPKPITTPPPTTPSPIITTLPSETQSPPITIPDNSDNITSEKLTVYDNTAKRYVTGNAYDIVCQNVLAEMGSSFHKEALKAQAIASYNHIKANDGRASLPMRSLDSVSASQRKIIEDNVAAVFGKMMYINNKAIDASYHASSAGTTLSARDVWGGTMAGHERVSTTFDTSDPNYGVIKFISAEDIKKAFSEKGISLSGNAKDWLSVKSYITGKYVNKIMVGNKELTGIDVRWALNLKSAAFEIKYYAETDVFTITTYGYGHGVGMSQNGANTLAKQGKTYDEILKTYYTGITIK